MFKEIFTENDQQDMLKALDKENPDIEGGLKVILVSKKPIKTSDKWAVVTKYKGNYIAGYYYGGSNSGPAKKFADKTPHDYKLVRQSSGGYWKIGPDVDEKWNGKF
jgi:hypothetical protein